MMNVYFGFTMAGDRSSVEFARRIVELLHEMGHRVLTSHLVEDGAREADRALGPREVYARDMAWLEQSDIFIAEVSGSSFGMGFETGYVLGSSDKRAILFYRREVEGRISLLITGNVHPRCTVVSYSGVEEMEDRLRALLG